MSREELQAWPKIHTELIEINKQICKQEKVQKSNGSI